MTAIPSDRRADWWQYVEIRDKTTVLCLGCGELKPYHHSNLGAHVAQCVVRALRHAPPETDDDICRKVLRVVVTTSMSFESTESTIFRELLPPRAALPCPDTLIRRTLEAANHYLHHVAHRSDLVVSFDGWVSPRREHLISIVSHTIRRSGLQTLEKQTELIGLLQLTGSHSADAISGAVQAHLAQYGFGVPLVALTDGASAAFKGARKLSELKDVVLSRCYAHLLQLVAGDVLRKLDMLCQRVLSFLALFARSALMQESLELRIPRPCRTRWLSWSATFSVITDAEPKISSWADRQADDIRKRAPTPAEYSTMRRALPILQAIDAGTMAVMADGATPTTALRAIRAVESATAEEVSDTSSATSSAGSDETFEESDSEAPLVDEAIDALQEPVDAATMRRAAAVGLRKRERYIQGLQAAALFDPSEREAVLRQLTSTAGVVREKKETPADWQRRARSAAIAKAVRMMAPLLRAPDPPVTDEECHAHPLAGWLRLPSDDVGLDYWGRNEISPEIRRAACLALALPVSSTSNERVFSMLRDILGVRAGGRMSPPLLQALAVLRHALRRDPKVELKWTPDGRRRTAPEAEAGGDDAVPVVTTALATSTAPPPTKRGRLAAGQQRLQQRLPTGPTGPAPAAAFP